MEKPKIANLIYLQNDAELDGIYFSEEGLSEDEESPFEAYDNQLKLKIGGHLGQASNLLIPYNLNGLSGSLPWSREHNILFDPSILSVMIAETGDYLAIQGDSRRIVLAHEPKYNGRMQQYTINCASFSSAPDIRVLPVPGRLSGLGVVFQEGGFESLPKMKEGAQGIISVSQRGVVIPGSVKTCF